MTAHHSESASGLLTAGKPTSLRRCRQGMVGLLLICGFLAAAPWATADELRLVFGSYRGGDFASKILSARPDGSDLRELSLHDSGRPASLDPWVSPDGDFILFTRGAGSHRSEVWQHSIHVLDLASGATTEITTGRYHDTRPNWIRTP